MTQVGKMLMDEGIEKDERKDEKKNVLHLRKK